MASNMTRTWGGLVLESRVEFGHAARRNRGRYTGKKVHRLNSEYVVGLVDGVEPGKGTVGAAFKKTGKPQLFSCHPACGCTGGQHGGSPYAGLTAEKVTCEKCLPAPVSVPAEAPSVPATAPAADKTVAGLTTRAVAVLKLLAAAKGGLTRAQLITATGMLKGWSKLLGAGSKGGTTGLEGRGLVKSEVQGRGVLLYTITAKGRCGLAIAQLITK